MSPAVDVLLSNLRYQPGLAIERSPGMTELKVGSNTIACVAERQAQLVVYAPKDVRAMLQAAYHGARPHPAGVAIDLTKAGHLGAGVALLRRRATVERLGWQYRERSP